MPSSPVMRMKPPGIRSPCTAILRPSAPIEHNGNILRADRRHPKQEGMIMIHPTIETLRRLRLTGMAKALEEQQGLPDCDRLSFDERLAMLVDREAVERDNAALAAPNVCALPSCARPPAS